MAGGAYNLGDVFVNFVANVEGMVAGLQEVAVASTETAAIATKDMERVGVAGTEAGAGIARSGVAAKEASGGFGALGGSLVKTLGPLVAAIVSFETLKKVFEETAKQADVVAQFNNALRDTKDASGQSTKGLQELAEKIESNSTFSKLDVEQAELMALSYKKLGKEVFPQTVNAAADLATRMKLDLPSATKLLSVALSDPEKAFGRLKKAGVVLNDQEKENIKTMQQHGDMVGAQKAILDAVAGTMGGSAATAAKTFGGELKRLRNESMTEMVNVAGKLVDGLNKLWPTIQMLAEKVGNFLKPSFEALGKSLEKFLPALAKLLPLFKPVAEVVGVILVAAIWLLVNVLNIVIRVLTDVIKWVEKHKEVMKVLGVAIIALVTGVFGLLIAGILLLAKHWKEISKTVEGVWHDITRFVTGIWRDVTGFFSRMWADVKKGFNDFVNFIKPIGIVVLAILLLPLVPAALAWRRFHQDIMQGLQAVANFFVGVFNFLKGILMSNINFYKSLFIDLYNVVRGIFQAAVNFIVSVFSPIVSFFGRIMSSIVGAIRGAVGGFASMLFGAGQSIIQGLIHGIESMAGAVMDKIKSIGKGIENTAKNILKIFSPSQVFHDIGKNVGQGLINGIDSMHEAVKNSAAGMASNTLISANDTLVGGIGQFAGAAPSLGNGPQIIVQLDGANIIGTVPRDVAEKIGDAIIGKLKQTVRI